MTQYWIQTPVENAKEVVQRKVDEISPNGGIVVSYDQNCEIVLYQNEWNNWEAPYPYQYIYFGTFFITQDGANLCSLDLHTNLNPIVVFNWETYPPNSGEYPYVMFNKLGNASTLVNNAYFVGYKFSITAPV